MSNSLCQICHERPANIFMTQVVNGQEQKQRLCEQCARSRAGDDRFFGGLPDEVTQAFGGGSLDEIVHNLFDQHFDLHHEPDVDAESDPFLSDEFPGDEDLVDELDEAASEEDDDSSWEIPDVWPSIKPIASPRCSRCETTWDRLRQDGRAGCPHCYTTFATELSGVMQRLQREEEHIGKRPRAAEKRRRRLEHLRVQRDNRMKMLQKRLGEAVAAERYEEAAKLRDKIKIVTATYVDGVE